MEKLRTTIYILVTVAIAVTGNAIAAHWGQQENLLSPWLIAVLLISPIVFITFGIISSKVGLAVASGVSVSLTTMTTMLIGLVFFNEWSRLSSMQYLGMVLVLAGISLMLFAPNRPTPEVTDSAKLPIL